MNERIEINPNVCHGSPVIRGTRVLVSQILEEPFFVVETPAQGGWRFFKVGVEMR